MSDYATEVNKSLNELWDAATALHDLIEQAASYRPERWLHNFGRCDEWNLCLIARTVVPANQERR